MSSISVLKWTVESGQAMAWVGADLYVIRPKLLDDEVMEWHVRLQNILTGTDELVAVTDCVDSAQKAAHEHSGDCG
jgi:hypothetical protein